MNSSNEFLKVLKESLNEVGGEAYLVGTFVRERLMDFKSQPSRLDIIYNGDINKLLMSLDNKQFSFYSLKENKDTYRYSGTNVVFNIAKMKGKNIEEDLGKRDFSINAICLKLIENKIIDPFNGRKAIKCRIIQSIRDTSIEEDPIRILRGIRFCIRYGMHFNLETENKIVDLSYKLKNSNKERIFTELMKLMEIDDNGRVFEVLDSYGILKNIFPYMEELKTVGKCKYHIEDAFTHMKLTYEVFKDVVKGRIKIEGLNLKHLEDCIDSFKIRECVSLACFLHDIGKFNCYKEKEDSVSFLGHEKEGAKIVNDICKDMRVPKKSAQLVEELVEAHMCPLEIFKMDENKRMEAAHKFFERYDKYFEFILIISLCDNYATYDSLYEDTRKHEYKKFIEKMICKYKFQK
ncbi:HD domain-containing protein [Clostridium scatologenes]|uniref:HD domain protein n=1 Tax=Clostridium scatologenes TaxID=1548 RepID=A0A0E3K3C6_CLOSL|nr:HD domain-containing protein [Clostridium scatologenes]AKA71155.1 HD domain protein [Clostridium scatologenes]